MSAHQRFSQQNAALCTNGRNDGPRCSILRWWPMAAMARKPTLIVKGSGANAAACTFRHEGRFADFRCKREISCRDQVKLTFRRRSQRAFLCTAARQLRALSGPSTNDVLFDYVLEKYKLACRKTARFCLQYPDSNRGNEMNSLTLDNPVFET
jgi:hypothetical protein